MGPDDRLDASLIALIDRMRASWFERMRQFDLSPVQAITLRALAEPASMGSLAEIHGCDASNITGVADRLAERGLVERLSDPADRRVKLLALTKNGHKLRERLFSEPVSRALPGIDSLSAAERRQLATLLERIVAD